MAAELTARDRQIAALLASGLSYSEAGARLKLSERTVRRAMERPELRAEVDRIRQQAVETGLGLLCAEFTQVIAALRKLRTKGTPKDAVKLGAVKLTIESVLRCREHVQLSREVAELREMLNEPAGGTEPPEETRGGAPGEPGGGGDPERAEGEPTGDVHEGGEPPGPVATTVDAGSLEAVFAAGFAPSGEV